MIVAYIGVNALFIIKAANYITWISICHITEIAKRFVYKSKV